MFLGATKGSESFGFLVGVFTLPFFVTEAGVFPVRDERPYFWIEACLLRSTQKTGDLSHPGDAGCGIVNVLAYRFDAGSETAGETIAIAEHGKEPFSQTQRRAPGFTID